MRNINQNVASGAAFIARLLQAFLKIEQDDSGSTKARKGASAVMKRAIYLSLDYWLTALEGILAFILLKVLPLEGLLLVSTIFLLLWGFEVICALGFIIVWKKTGIDITLSEDLRRAVDVLSDTSRKAGKTAYLMKIVKAIIWDGPEEIIIFCSKEIDSRLKMTLIILGVTAFQAIFWGGAFIGGFEFISSIFN